MAPHIQKTVQKTLSGLQTRKKESRILSPSASRAPPASLGAERNSLWVAEMVKGAH